MLRKSWVTFIVAMVAATAASGAEPGDLLWAVRSGGAGQDRGSCVASFPDGSQVVAGSVGSSYAIFGDDDIQGTLLQGGPLGFVARYALDGTVVWVKGMFGDVFPHGIATFPDGSCVVVGEYPTAALFGRGEENETLLKHGRAFLARYAPDGSLVWARSAGPAGEEVYAKAALGVASFADGSFVAVGYTQPSFDTELFVAKYASDGTTIWTRVSDGLGDEFANGVAALQDGSVILTGSFATTIVLGAGEPQETNLTSSGSDVLLARYAADGALMWARRAGGAGDDSGKAVAAFPDGSVVMVGNYAEAATFGSGPGTTTLALFGSSDIFVARYSADGFVEWAKRIGGTETDEALAAATLPDGTVAVAGAFWGFTTLAPGEPQAKIFNSLGRADTFVAVYSGDGTLEWARRAGGTETDRILGITTLGDGSIVATGSYQGTATFGPGEANQTSLESWASEDGFVARLAGQRLIAAPATVVQECDEGADGATVNFTFDVGATSQDLLVVRDETGGRTLLEVAGPTAGTYGVGPVLFPHGTSAVVIELSAAGSVLESATVQVTIADTTPPLLRVAGEVTLELQGPLTPLTKALLDVEVSDNCDPSPTLVISPDAVPLGRTGVVLSALDATGNRTLAKAAVTIVDTTPPTFTVVPDDIERECADARGSPVDFDVLAEDLSGPVMLTFIDENGMHVPSGWVFPIGRHQIACNATDSSGNTARCEFLITIVDHEAPLILVPDDITVPTEPGEAFAFVEFTVTVTDDCSPVASLDCIAPWGRVVSGSAFPLGTTTVECTAEDSVGNVASASFRVTVVDREPPQIVAPKSVTVVMDGSCAECTGTGYCRCGRCDARRHGKARRRCAKGVGDATVTLTPEILGVEVTDDGDPTPTVVISPPAVGPGRYDVTVTATDDDGNTSTAVMTVIVTKPPLECQVLRPLDGNVDNRIRAGRTVPLRLKVTCNNIPVCDATVTLDDIVQLDADGTPIANDAGDDDLVPDSAFHVRGDRYHMNLSTAGWENAPGTRYEVLLRVQRDGHADGFCAVRFVIK